SCPLELRHGHLEPYPKGHCASVVWSTSAGLERKGHRVLSEGHRCRASADHASCRIRRGAGIDGENTGSQSRVVKGQTTQTDGCRGSAISGRGRSEVKVRGWKNSSTRALKNSRSRERFDAELGTRLLVLLGF